MVKYLRFLLTFLLLGTAFTSMVTAQELDPDQPEQDACNAILLCGTSFFSPYSYQGEGLESDLTSSPCSGGEGNSVWFILNVATSGTIMFTIAPVSVDDDYDFLVVDMTETTCDDLSSGDVVRCNFNNNSPGSNIDGIVGVGDSGTSDYVTAGTTGSSYCNTIDAVAGETYLIMINNFGNYVSGGISSGFTLDFAGSTATFNTDGPPTFDSIEVECDLTQGLTLHMTQEINCASISGDGSDYYLTPSGTITSVTGVGCNDDGEGYTDILKFTFSPALGPGTYTIHPQAGSDTNSVLDLCNEEQPYGDVISFTIPPLPELISATLTCTTIMATTNVPVRCATISPSGSEFAISGPGTVGIVAAEPIGCTASGFTNTIKITLAGPIPATGTYSIVAQTGTDGNTMLDSCGFAQAVGSSFSFDISSLTPELSLPDTITTCIRDSISLPLEVLNEAEGVTYGFAWNPPTALSSTAAQQPMAAPPSIQTYDVYVYSSDPTACPSRDTITVRVLQGFDIQTNDTALCEGTIINILTIGENEYSYTWSPEDAVGDPHDKNTTITATTATTYSLTASYPGCTDSTQYIHIDVQNYPFVELGTFDRYKCYYDSVLIESTVTPAVSTLYDYVYTWTPAGAYAPSGLPNTIYYGDSTATLYLTVSTAIGCNATDSVRIHVYPRFFTTLSVSDTGVCPGDSVQLGISGGSTYRWMPAYGLSDSTSATPVAAPQTSTEYTVTAYDQYGCTTTQNVFVQAYPGGVLNLPDSVNIYPGESYEINPETNCLYFSWFPPSGLSAANIANPIAQPEVRTRYFVNATTEYGCPVSDSMDILVVETVLDIPNAFVPGNGSNSVFKIAKRGIATLKAFQVFDRWGLKVFETTNIETGWDGTYNGKPQPMGVYVYVIDGITDSGKAFVKHGNVTLIR